MTKNVLVTGGAGYIGSHACKELARAGFTPIAFDNLSRGNRSAVRFGPLVVGDLANKHDIRMALSTYKIGAVLHFAAYAYVEESVRSPGLYFQNNVAGSINLLDAMAEAQVKNLIFSSTCAVYGTPETNPITETTPTIPINPYGESKLQVERLIQWYERSHGLKWTALRYFNAAGADPDGEIGECHDPETHLLPLAIQAALGEAPPLQVRGTDYPTLDGTAVRDFVHVSDLAQAHVLALEYLLKGGEPGAFNLGTGKGHSIRQVLAEIERSSGLSVPYRESERRPGDPPALVADPKRANSVLGWRPRRSDLATIVETALAWQRSQTVKQAAE